MRCEDINRNFRHDEILKRGLLSRVARIAPMTVMDAEELSARELAGLVLKKLGLKIPADPISALSSWLDGHDSGQRDAAGGRVQTEGMDSAGNFVNRYLASE